jgi:G3E family GTPase
MRVKRPGEGPLSTYLVCGFLGAGKTTYILERLRDKSSRTAVLVNEFGTLGIDGQIIRTKGGVDVVEMAGGCICCSQRQGLVKSVTEIARDIRPDVLLIEPSGVAETSELLKALSDDSLGGIISCDATITIIDATTFLDYSAPDSFGTFFLDQVENADVVLINKIDLVDPGLLVEIEARIDKLNPGAIVVRTDHCRDSGTLPQTGRTRPIISHKKALEFDSVSFELQKPIPSGSLERFLCRLKEGAFGEILRAKGFVQIEGGACVEVQTTPAQVLIEPVECRTPPKMIFLGLGLKRSALEGYFASGGISEDT